MEKIIEIRFDGFVRPRFFRMHHEDAEGRCYLSEKGVKYILSQSVDNNVYYGTTPIIEGENMDLSGLLYALPKDITYLNIKKQSFSGEAMYMAKPGAWKWEGVELRVIEVED